MESSFIDTLTYCRADGLRLVDAAPYDTRRPCATQANSERPQKRSKEVVDAGSLNQLEKQAATMSPAGTNRSALNQYRTHDLRGRPVISTLLHCLTETPLQQSCSSNSQRGSPEGRFEQPWVHPPPRTQLEFEDFENYCYINRTATTTETYPSVISSQHTSMMDTTATKDFDASTWILPSSEDHYSQAFSRLQTQLDDAPMHFNSSSSDEHKYVPLPMSAMHPVPYTIPPAGFLEFAQRPSHGQLNAPFSLSHYPCHAQEEVPSEAPAIKMPLSPCESTLKAEPDMVVGEEATSPVAESDQGSDGLRESSYPHLETSSRASSLSPTDLDQGENSAQEKSDSKFECEPYAKLIYRAFKKHPRHAMTLQELYQWFRENTDKGKGVGKGWMNSIRHNLSMNAAFTKRECKPPDEAGADGDTSGSKCADHKKNTEWFLEKWALDLGYPYSTTRYRKGCPSRRGFCGPKRSKVSYPKHSDLRHNGRASLKKAATSRSRQKPRFAPSRSASEPQQTNTPEQQLPNPPFSRGHHNQHDSMIPMQYCRSSFDISSSYTYPDPAFLVSSTAASAAVAAGRVERTAVPLPSDPTIKREPCLDEPLTPDGEDFTLLPNLRATGLPNAGHSHGGYYFGGGEDHSIDLSEYRLPRVAGVYGEKNSALQRYVWEGEGEARYPHYPL